MITELEQETSDFDWYFTNGNNIGYIASGGGKLPLTISRSLRNIKILAEFFWELPIVSGFVINPHLKEILKVKRVTDIYLSSFIYFAERGVFTFDKTTSNNFRDMNYHMVAQPNNPIPFNELPIEISNIILLAKDIDPNRFKLDVNM